MKRLVLTIGNCVLWLLCRELSKVGEKDWAKTEITMHLQVLRKDMEDFQDER